MNANIKAAINAIIKINEYLSNWDLSNEKNLKLIIIGINANKGIKYRVLMPKPVYPTLAQVSNWTKHVPT